MFGLVPSVGTCIVDVLILDKHCNAFCLLKNSGRLFIVKPKANMPSVDRQVMHYLFVFVFSFDTRCQAVNGPTPGDYKLQNPIEQAFFDWRIMKEYCVVRSCN